MKMTIDELVKLVEEKGPYALADALGIVYFGDVSPLAHGGMFFETRNWLDHGYASVVELYDHYNDGEDLLLVTSGTISRQEDEGEEYQRSAQRCAGDEAGWEECREAMRADPNISPQELIMREVEACQGYAGIEPEYDGYRTYRMNNWPKEHRLWRSIMPLIVALAEE